MATKQASKTATKGSSAKTAAKKGVAKKSVAKKSVTEAASKTGAVKKTVAKKSAGRKYSPAAGAQVARELHEMHEGKLTIGKSDQKVTNPKQAIAIALSEARRAGKKVPPNPNDPKKK